MKIKISEPVVIARGPSYEECGWGPYQFPDLFQLPDGRIMCAFADSTDTVDAYGAERACFVSSDRGATWERARERDFDTVVGIQLDNGDRVQFIEQASIKVTDDMKFPQPVVSKYGTSYYRPEDLDDSIYKNRTWMLHRVSAEHPEGVEEPVTVNWPHMTVRVREGIVIPLQPWGRLRKAPDGALWMPDYMVGLNPNNGGFSPFSSNYTFCSTDNGKTWDLKHFLPYVPNTEVDPNAFLYEGYNENDIGFAPDGSYIRLIRMNGTSPLCKGPCWLVRSTDKGETWSDPIYFDERGVWPRLCTLKCGVMLASYGRPGFYVRATSDPSALKWEDPIELIHVPEGKSVWAASCSYSDLMPLDDHTAGLIYTNFKLKDENGKACKTVLFSTITVEE